MNFLHIIFGFRKCFNDTRTFARTHTHRCTLIIKRNPIFRRDLSEKLELNSLQPEFEIRLVNGQEPR